MPKPNNIIGRAHQGVKGRYKVEVVDSASGQVVESRPWANNLILDQGLNQLFTLCSLSQAFTHCAVGTGTTPTYRDSAAVTISVTSGTATASSSFFEAADAANNRVLKLDSGEEYRITAFTSDTIVTVTGPDAAASVGTVWFVEQTGLTSEQKRTATYLTGTGNCGSTFVSNTVTMLRTYDFTTEVGNQNYTELGWSYIVTVAANLFSRTLIAGGTVTVLTGQALRVRYELSVTVGPTTPTAGAPAITGWPVAPSTVLDGDGQGTMFSSSNIGTVATNGLSTSSYYYGWIQSSWDTYSGPGAGAGTGKAIALSTSTTIPAFGTTAGQANVLGVVAGAGSYTIGSFKRQWSGGYGVNVANRTDWRSVMLCGTVQTGPGGPQPGDNCYVFRWDENQTKDNLHTLTLAFEMSVGRILTNP